MVRKPPQKVEVPEVELILIRIVQDSPVVYLAVCHLHA